MQPAPALCAACWLTCTFLSSPCCFICGWPFPHEMPEGAQCLSCSRQPPDFVQGRSALAYDEGCRGFILKFKEGDATYLAPGLAHLMFHAGRDILFHTDLLVPVPLHWQRLFRRQYNQAALLAGCLASRTGIPTRPDLVKRHRPTPKQGFQNRKARFENVRGAFQVPANKISCLQGKRLTLIDDVYTTGATLNECASALLKAGAKEIRVLTLARVILPA